MHVNHKECILPDDYMAGVYIIECDRLIGTFKIGWTRNINKRLWHATYDAFGQHKQYAYALLFRFQDTTSDTAVYRKAEQDELEWIEHFEALVLADTQDYQETDMGGEWRMNMSIDECIGWIQNIAHDVVTLLPEDIRPELNEVFHFRPSRLYKVCQQHTRYRVRRKRSLFRRWKTIAGTMQSSRTVQQPTRTPTKEQELVVNKALEWFTSTSLPCAMQLRWMCGMGKTWCALLLFHKLVSHKHAKTCVIAVPSLKLVAQWIPDIQMMFQTWYPTGKGIPLLLIGSAQDDSDACNDSVAPNTADTRSVTTDPRVIRDFCENECQRATYDRPAMVLGTYHSAHRLVEATTRSKHQFDLLVCDEAHHLTGVTARENLRPFLQTHLIPNRCKLSMTATPKCFKTDTKTEHQMVYSMDNMEQFGKVLDTKSLHWAIEHHKVSDYRVCMIRRGLATVVQWMSQLDGSRASATNMEKHICLAYASYIAADLLLRGTNKKLLLYANKTEHADLACSYIKQFIHTIRVNYPDEVHYERVHVCSLHASTTSPEAKNASERRAEELKFEHAHSGVICCVQIYAEGVNMPFLDGVVFGEQMQSDERIVQSAFRCNRLDPNNPHKVASIVIPVLIPEEFSKQEGPRAFDEKDCEYINEEEQKRQTNLCKRMNFGTVQKVLEKIRQHGHHLATRIEVREVSLPFKKDEHSDEEHSDADATTKKREQEQIQTQKMRDQELNEVVKNMVYKFINRGDLIQWTAPHLVRRVKELSAQWSCDVYNEDTYQTLCAQLKDKGATTELPRRSPTTMFKPHAFAWEQVDPHRDTYYTTADECKHAVERLDEDEFIKRCKEHGIEPSAYHTLTRVSDIYHEMDKRVPVGLCDRYYLRKEDAAPVQYAVDGVFD